MTEVKVEQRHTQQAVALLEAALYPLDAVKGVELIAQALAAADLAGKEQRRLLDTVSRWLHSRGHKSAATDLTYNWNDPGQPGDGSCLPLHVERPAKLEGG